MLHEGLNRPLQKRPRIPVDDDDINYWQQSRNISAHHDLPRPARILCLRCTANLVTACDQQPTESPAPKAAARRKGGIGIDRKKIASLVDRASGRKKLQRRRTSP